MLTLRPRRNEGEGVPQYLARLAATNGYESLTAFLREFGLGEFGVMSGTMPDWGVLLPGRPDGAAGAGGLVAGRWVTVSGRRIRRKQWSVHASPRICPQCWQADLAYDDERPGLLRNWQRTVWDVRPLTVCEVHGVELVDHCSCGKPLSRKDWLLDRCQCGLLLHDLEAVPIDAELMRGPGYIYDRLAGRSTAVPLLDRVELGDAIAAMEIFGRAVFCEKADLNDDARSPKHHALLSAGFEILDRWPNGAIELFDKMISHKTNDDGWGVVQAYGPFYEMFRRIEPSSLRDEVAGLLARHGVRNGVVRSKKSAFGVTVSDRTTHSLRATAERLGLSYERTRREVQSRGLDVNGIERGRPALVPETIVEKIEIDLASRGITASALRRQLAVGKGTFQDLVDRSLLCPRLPGRPLSFDGDAAEKFVRSLATAGIARRESRPIKEISKRYCVSIAQICEDIVEGRLPCGAVGDGEFSALRVCNRRAASLYQSAETPRLTVRQIAGRIRVKWEVADALSRLGFFGPKEDGGFRSIDVALFMRNYRKNADLARDLKTSPKRLLQMSKDAGIPAAAAPPQVRQAFFGVEAAEKLRSLASEFQV